MFDHKRIVTVLPKRLGDAVFITPALAFIKKHNPHCHLTVVALSGLSAEVVVNNPAVDVVLTELTGEYDAVLQLHHNSQVAAVVAEVEAEKYIMPVHKSATPKADHSLEFLAALMQKKVGGHDRHYWLYPLAADDAYIDALLAEQGLMAQSMLVGMHIGCHGVAKKRWRFWKKLTHEKVWPLANFIALAQKLEACYPSIRFVVTGSKAEASLANDFCKKIKSAIDLTSQTNVQQLAALMKKIDVYVTPDTGALHVACAMNCASVSLYLSCNYPPCQPYPPSINKCSLQADDISSIAVDSVVEKLQELLV